MGQLCCCLGSSTRASPDAVQNHGATKLESLNTVLHSVVRLAEALPEFGNSATRLVSSLTGLIKAINDLIYNLKSKTDIPEKYKPALRKLKQYADEVLENGTQFMQACSDLLVNGNAARIRRIKNDIKNKRTESLMKFVRDIETCYEECTKKYKILKDYRFNCPTITTGAVVGGTAAAVATVSAATVAGFVAGPVGVVVTLGVAGISTAVAGAVWYKRCNSIREAIAKESNFIYEWVASCHSDMSTMNRNIEQCLAKIPELMDKRSDHKELGRSLDDLRKRMEGYHNDCEVYLDKYRKYKGLSVTKKATRFHK